MSLRDIIINANKEKERRKRIEATKRIATGATVGISLGLALGVLFAPKSGKETREDIKEGLHSAKDSLAEASKTIKEKAVVLSEDLKTKAHEMIASIKEKQSCCGEEDCCDCDETEE